MHLPSLPWNVFVSGTTHANSVDPHTRFQRQKRRTGKSGRRKERPQTIRTHNNITKKTSRRKPRTQINQQNMSPIPPVLCSTSRHAISRPQIPAKKQDQKKKKRFRHYYDTDIVSLPPTNTPLARTAKSHLAHPSTRKKKTEKEKQNALANATCHARSLLHLYSCTFRHAQNTR
jgi:hypothetical protein